MPKIEQFAEGFKPDALSTHLSAKVRPSVLEHIMELGERNNWSKSLAVKVLIDEALELRSLYEGITGRKIVGALDVKSILE